MNFEFKSTFINNIQALIASAKRIHHTTWILSVNLCVALTATILYLNNYVLPATIGSRYYGHYYVRILETGGQLIVITSLYAVIFIAVNMLVKFIPERQIIAIRRFLFSLFQSCTQSFIKIIIMINLFRDIRLHGYAAIYPFPLTPYGLFWEQQKEHYAFNTLHLNQ